MLFVIALFFLCADAFTARSQKNGYTVIAKSVTSQSTINHIVDYHNRERREFGSPSIQWDAGLAKESAQLRANIGCKGNTHCTNCVENLRAFASDTDVNTWAATNEAWVGSKSPFCWQTGSYDGGHYRSVISSSYDRVGCAATQNCRALLNQGKVDNGWNPYACLYKNSKTGQTFKTDYNQEFKNSQAACDKYIPASEKNNNPPPNNNNNNPRPNNNNNNPRPNNNNNNPRPNNNNNNNNPRPNNNNNGNHQARCGAIRSSSTCKSDRYCSWNRKQRKCKMNLRGMCDNAKSAQSCPNSRCTWSNRKCIKKPNRNNAVDDEGEDEEFLDMIENMENVDTNNNNNNNSSSDNGISGSITAVIVLVVLNVVLLIVALLITVFKG